MRECARGTSVAGVVKNIGETSRWEQAQQALLEAIKAQGLSYEVDEGGGAFYGPKIDMKIKDAIGREWQMTTIQFDFNLPERFDLTYVGEDGQRHRPYRIHRALLGSFERFFGVLIEHCAGNFPLWFTPKQIAVININSDQEALSVDQLLEKLRIEVETKETRV
jgi:threonyl-tRNA synthetase